MHNVVVIVGARSFGILSLCHTEHCGTECEVLDQEVFGSGGAYRTLSRGTGRKVDVEVALGRDSSRWWRQCYVGALCCSHWRMMVLCWSLDLCSHRGMISAAADDWRG